MTVDFHHKETRVETGEHNGVFVCKNKNIEIVVAKYCHISFHGRNPTVDLCFDLILRNYAFTEKQEVYCFISGAGAVGVFLGRGVWAALLLCVRGGKPGD